MASGAALRASAISASRSIRYCSSGAMVAYGCLASWAATGHGAPRAARMSALTEMICSFLGFIGFLLYWSDNGLVMACNRALVGHLPCTDLAFTLASNGGTAIRQIVQEISQLPARSVIRGEHPGGAFSSCPAADRRTPSKSDQLTRLDT